MLCKWNQVNSAQCILHFVHRYLIDEELNTGGQKM